MNKQQAVAAGANYHKLAGTPTPEHTKSIFGNAGYSLSWANRAVKLNVTPEALCAMFKDNPAQVKELWAALPQPTRKNAPGTSAPKQQAETTPVAAPAVTEKQG